MDLPDGARLTVHGLRRVMWRRPGITKGELMPYYVRVSPVLLPAVDGRPLGARYHPHGVGGPAYFQQRAPLVVPDAARIELLPLDLPVRRRIVGGPLFTLLWVVDLDVLSQDPWLSRLPDLNAPDHAVLDLDPMPDVAFTAVRDVARWVHDELARRDVAAAVKTSGASGLHVVVPLRAGATFEHARTFCEAVAARVAAHHPAVATVERSTARRGRRVYIDCLQNLRTKTLACAYSARASAFAGVSTPLTWRELDDGARPEDFTARSVPGRLAEVGDLWARVRIRPRLAPRAA